MKTIIITTIVFLCIAIVGYVEDPCATEGLIAGCANQCLTNPVPHGNIKYSEKTNEVIMELGTKIIGDFGGYTPLWNGEVITVSPAALGAEVKVRWDEGGYTWLDGNEIDAKKGIGYFTEEGYYA